MSLRLFKDLHLLALSHARHTKRNRFSEPLSYLSRFREPISFVELQFTKPKYQNHLIMENHIQDSKNIVTGHIDAQGNVIVGDVQQTVNYYLSINKDLEELKAKIEKLEKEIKEADSPKFKAYLQKELFEQKETYQKQFKAIEQAYYDVMKFNFTDEELKELQLLFLKGEHEEIRKKVNPVAIAHNIEMREKANEQDAYKMLVLAKSMAIQFDNPNRFEKTVEYYEISLQAERNLTNIFAFAHFL